ncbi:hypothetical protein GCM10027046_05080 [Uliginosibacterium flavum]|uniref:Uncharacterized protein n=1 Tax=Uliginosibacterium flavum TaxID=1396831 RepID=A0ABV2TJ26_9RHOO
MHAPSARKILQDQPLTGPNIRSIMRRIFPKRNDYVSDITLFEELLPELARFEITTRGQLKRLLTKYRRALLTDDRSPLSSVEQKYYCEWFGAEHTKNAIKRQYWFGYPALVRNALESKFGEQAEVWSDEPESLLST